MKIRMTRAQVRTFVAVCALACAAAPVAARAALPEHPATPAGLVEPQVRADSANTWTVAAAALSGVVNVNAASLDQLQMLPGVGESRAKAIVAARKQRGGFKSVDELVEVKGIGEALLARLRPYVRTSGNTTVTIAQ